MESLGALHALERKTRTKPVLRSALHVLELKTSTGLTFEGGVPKQNQLAVGTW